MHIDIWLRITKNYEKYGIKLLNLAFPKISKDCIPPSTGCLYLEIFIRIAFTVVFNWANFHVLAGREGLVYEQFSERNTFSLEGIELLSVR